LVDKSEDKCFPLIKHFDYSLYPEHVDLNKYHGLHCSYAFKPIIIYNEATAFTVVPVIWLDCACKASCSDLSSILKSIHLYGFYCPVGNEKNTIESIELNHPTTIEIMGLTREQHFNELETRLALTCGVKYNMVNGKFLLDEWYKYSLDKNVITPEGSSRNNHRQDQKNISREELLNYYCVVKI
jgi:hypothetical protein